MLRRIHFSKFAAGRPPILPSLYEPLEQDFLQCCSAEFAGPESVGVLEEPINYSWNSHCETEKPARYDVRPSSSGCWILVNPDTYSWLLQPGP